MEGSPSLCLAFDDEFLGDRLFVTRDAVRLSRGAGTGCHSSAPDLRVGSRAVPATTSLVSTKWNQGLRDFS
jgi:hypothetical protein